MADRHAPCGRDLEKKTCQSIWAWAPLEGGVKQGDVKKVSFHRKHERDLERKTFCLIWTCAVWAASEGDRKSVV